MQEYAVVLFGIAGLAVGGLWICFAMVRWRHMAFRNALVTLRRISQLQDPEVSRQFLSDFRAPLPPPRSETVSPAVRFSAGVLVAIDLLAQARPKLSNEGFGSYCYRLLFEIKRSDLQKARRLAVELRDTPDSALLPTGLQQVAQHRHRLGLASSAIWRFLDLAVILFQVETAATALENPEIAL